MIAHQWYGWNPDVPDVRDFDFKPTFFWWLPRDVDLRPRISTIFDQGPVGSCTANAISSAMKFVDAAQGESDVTPSRLFIYYAEREAEGSAGVDEGAMIRTGIKCVASVGVCPEEEWPYDVDKVLVKPDERCYQDALKERALWYGRVGSGVRAMRSALASGFPVVFGCSVYDSFESNDVALTGLVPMPEEGERPVGAHAMLCVGYDNDQQLFIVQNSWGADWGDKGSCYMPYSYLGNSNLADDKWVIKKNS
jgi:C1A family cysteine protease